MFEIQFALLYPSLKGPVTPEFTTKCHLMRGSAILVKYLQMSSNKLRCLSFCQFPKVVFFTLEITQLSF